MTTKHNIPWSIPAKFDENETDVRVSFFFSPGNHSTSLDPTDSDPPIIEDILIIYPDGKRIVPEGELLENAGFACWDHIWRTSPPNSKEDL